MENAHDVAAAERRTRTWRRDNRLRHLGYASYTAYIHSPEWQAKRAAFWEDADTPKDCAVCGGDALLLHHKTYDRAGEEDFDDLAPICDPCHRLVHELERRGDLRLDFDGLVDAARAAAHRRKQQETGREDAKALRELRELEINVSAHRRKPKPGRLATEHLRRKEKRLAKQQEEL